MTGLRDMNLTPITDHDSRLAVELAVQISPVEEILRRHDLTADELRAKMKDPTFRNMVREARRTWNSDLSVKDRIKLKTQVLVEDSLLGLYTMFHDVNVAPPARLDAFKQMARVAAVDTPEKAGPGGGERVSISINLGADRQPLTIQASALPAED